MRMRVQERTGVPIRDGAAWPPQDPAARSGSPASQRLLLRKALAVWVFCAALPIGAVAQTAATAPKVSDAFLYHCFFAEVASWERLADREPLTGPKSGAARHHIKAQAQLTDQEETVLKAIAKSYRAGFGPIRDRARQIAATYGSRELPAGVLKELAELAQQRRELMAKHLQQLRSALGPVRFQLLDAYVRKTVLPKVRVVSGTSSKG